MTGNNNYCVRLNEFEKNVKISWQKLQMENNLCDITLACEDKEIKAHKLVISSFSPVLRNILKLNYSSHPMIYLRRVKYRNLQNLLNFMYQGEVNVAKEDLPSFLEVAKDLNVRGLCEKNIEYCDSNEEDTLQFTNLNIHPSLKRKRNIKNEKVKNVNDDSTEINNEINCNQLFNPKEIVRKVTSQVCAENTNHNSITTVPVKNEVDNAIDTKILFVKKEIAENIEQNGFSKVQVPDARTSLPCGQCTYKATKMSNLTEHIRSIHEGVRYPCGQCNYRATFKPHLLEHIRGIHEGVRYACDQCNYKATQNQHLTRHIKSIHEGERFPCNMCDYKATEKCSLKRHQLKKHN